MISINRTTLKLRPLDYIEYTDDYVRRYQSFDFKWFKIHRIGFKFWIEPVRYCVLITREIDV